MSVPISNVSRRVVLAASGTGPYSFNFEILANTDISVYRDDTLLTLTTDYTVTINTNGTGYVTLTATPTGATQIAIVGDRAIQRTSDFTTGGDLFATTLNDELDSLTIFAQQNAESADRALKIPVTDPVGTETDLPKASDRANKYLAFNSTGAIVASSGTTNATVISTVMEPVVGAASLTIARTAMGVPGTGSANTFTAANTFSSGNLKLSGSTSGTATLNAPAIAGTNTYTLPPDAATIGYRNIPISGSAKTGSYTLTTSDVGEYIEVGSGGSITIPTSTFAAGDAITLFNNTTGNVTITCSAPTTYLSGVNTARTSLTLATRGIATVFFISATVCIVTGSVS